MSILSYFGIQSATPQLVEEEISADMIIIEKMLSDEAHMKDVLKKIMDNFSKLREEEIQEYLADVEKTDRRLLKILRQRKDKNEFQKTQEILRACHTYMNNGGGLDKKNGFEEIVKYLRRLVIQLIEVELEEKSKDLEILEGFRELCGEHITKENIDFFFKKHSNFFGAKPHKRLAKDMRKVLANNAEVIPLYPGSRIKEKEIINIKEKVRQYLVSPEFRLYSKGYPETEIEIVVAIYGSLVTGFASKYSLKHPGAPTDSDGISDADLGITIFDPKFFAHIHNAMPDDLQARNGKRLYAGPVKKQNKERAGPFMDLFDLLQQIPFAGRYDRVIGIIFINEDFYNSSFQYEEKIILFSGTVKLH